MPIAKIRSAVFTSRFFRWFFSPEIKLMRDYHIDEFKRYELQKMLEKRQASQSVEEALNVVKFEQAERKSIKFSKTYGESKAQ